MTVSRETDGGEARRKQILRWYAEAHDELDRQGIPRFADPPAEGLPLHEHTLPDRVRLLAQRKENTQ